MTREMLSASRLKKLYYLSTHGDTPAEAGRNPEVKMTAGQASQALRKIKKYMAWILDGSIKKRTNLRKTYLFAAQDAIEKDKMRITKKEGVKTTEAPVEATVIPASLPAEADPSILPHYDKLGMAFSLFSDHIYAFIAEEVKRQVEPYKQENEALKKILDDAKIGNWADGLRKRLAGE